MPTPVLIALIIIGAFVVLIAAAVLTIRHAAPMLVRTAIGRLVLSKIAKLGMRAARKKAEREGTTTDATGARLSDAEIMLREHGGEQARQMEAMMAALAPAERARVRRTMDNLDLGAMAGAMDEGPDGEGLDIGREAKRALERLSVAPTGPGGARTLTPAQAKAKQKARAARKRKRR